LPPPEPVEAAPITPPRCPREDETEEPPPGGGDGRGRADVVELIEDAGCIERMILKGLGEMDQVAERR